MGAVSRKDRWWTTKLKEDPRGYWYALGTEKSGLRVAALTTRSRPLDLDHVYAESPFLAAHPLIEQLGGCKQCTLWDPEALREPIDVVVEPTNKKQCTVASRYTDRLWVSGAGWADCSIIHRELFDVLAPHMSDGIVVGDVVVRGGDQVHELLVVSDPDAPTVRTRYSKDMFESNPRIHGWAPCHGCGRLLKRRNWWAQYLLASEHADRKVRVYRGMVLTPPEVAEACGFRDPERFRGMSLRPVPSFLEPMDPMPSPTPMTWEELEERFAGYGYDLPFPKVCRYDLDPTWINARVARLGEDACTLRLEGIQGSMECERIASRLFSVRMRGLFEERVGARIEGMDEQTLIQYLVDYNHATQGMGGSFPL